MPDFTDKAREWMWNITFAPNTPDALEQTKALNAAWERIQPVIHPMLVALLEETWQDGHHDGYTDCQVTDR